MIAFVDTNILIYAFVTSLLDPLHKVRIARALIAQLTQRRELVTSVQVLSEFAVNASRKGNPPLHGDRILQIIQNIGKHPVIPIDALLVQQALRRVQQSRISYWDALIVEAAISSGATILYTEDMHHGTRYGNLELRNPFLA